MSRSPFAIPLRPSYDEAETARLRAFWRALTAFVLAQLSRDDPVDVVRRNWERDEAAHLITRAVVNPASTTGWGVETLSTFMGPFLAGIATRSAAARLFAEALQIQLAGICEISLPRMSTTPAPVFVAEGEPPPVIEGVFENVTLGPTKKMMLISGLTNELAQHSADSAEGLIRTAIGETAATSVDPVVFDANPASESRPAGLLYSVAPIAAQAGGGAAAMVSDLQNMIGAIATAGGGTNVWLFASPPQATAIGLLAGSRFSLPVLSTPALASGTVVAIEVGAIASGYSGLPEIETSAQATVHWESETPASISEVGEPNPISAPVRSAWQQNHLLLRLILRCAWTTRAPGMVQYVTGTTW
jgi:hypothetical protein